MTTTTKDYSLILNRLYLILDDKSNKTELSDKRFVIKTYRDLEKIGFNKFDISDKETCRVICLEIFIEMEW